MATPTHPIDSQTEQEAAITTRKIVLLDGTGRRDDDLAPITALLLDELRRSGAQVQYYALRDAKLGTCIGCFGCWLETPGVCVEPDQGRDLAQAVVQSDTTIILSPVTFGGYSSEIKKTQDRWLPLVLPYFGVYHGEVHHVPRYARYPRIVGIGVQRRSNEEEARIFRALVGRNALNFHAPTHAAEVVVSTEAPDQLRRQLVDALNRNDPLPLGPRIESVMPTLCSAANHAPGCAPRTDGEDRSNRALLIVGSPKVKSASTSGVLGHYVLDQLEHRGWETESLTLRRKLLTDHGQTELLEGFDRADLILLTFPLYIDSLPFLVMRSLELMAEHGTTTPEDRPKRFVAIANNGFPEAHHNAAALAICHRFAVDTGMVWSGGMAMGAGEALVGGQPFAGTRRPGPPVDHVARALDLASAALADGQMVPIEAIELIAKKPVPLIPSRLWRWLFQKTANRHWRRQAATHEVQPPALTARPYANAGRGDAAKTRAME